MSTGRYYYILHIYILYRIMYWILMYNVCSLPVWRCPRRTTGPGALLFAWSRRLYYETAAFNGVAVNFYSVRNAYCGYGCNYCCSDIINSAEIIMDTTWPRPWYRSSRSTTNKTRRRWPLSVGGGGRRTIIVVVVVAGVSRTCCPRGVRSTFDDSDSRGLRLTARVVRRRRRRPAYIYIYQYSAQKSSSRRPPQPCALQSQRCMYTAKIKKISHQEKQNNYSI